MARKKTVPAEQKSLFTSHYEEDFCSEPSVT